MGRPHRPDEQTRAVLAAPIEMSSPRWGSRALAAHVGVTQSTVARVWADTFHAPTEDPVRLSSLDVRIAGVDVSPTSMVIVLTGRPTQATGDRGSQFMRSSRRVALQTLLAADLVRKPGDAHSDAPSDLVHFVTEIARGQSSGQVTIALTRADIGDVSPASQVIVDDDLDWQRLLRPFVQATAHAPPTELAALQLRLMEWARGRRAHFRWAVGDAAPPVRRDAQSAPTPATQPLSQQIARDAFGVVLARVAAGQLGAGDRITETSLARSLRTSRSYVREALKSLAADGLVDLEPRRGAVVPVPRVGDVIDTYSARRALGTLLVQRAATASVRDLGPAERALTEMLSLAEKGDARATGDADLRFQDAMAAATAMRQVPGMFRTLTAQVLMYTTVMGLTYVYSIPHMCRDDIAILAAVRRRDVDQAVALWQAKVDASLDFMATKL